MGIYYPILIIIMKQYVDKFQSMEVIPIISVGKSGKAPSTKQLSRFQLSSLDLPIIIALLYQNENIVLLDGTTTETLQKYSINTYSKKCDDVCMSFL